MVIEVNTNQLEPDLYFQLPSVIPLLMANTRLALR